jgi:hypothetical protein
MSLPRILNPLSFVALVLAYVLTGYVVSISGEFYARMVCINLPGRPLAAITDIILYCDGSAWPRYLGVLIGLGFAGSLALLDRRNQTRKFVPLALTIAWGLCVLHLPAFVIAAGLLSVPVFIR